MVRRDLVDCVTSGSETLVHQPRRRLGPELPQERKVQVLGLPHVHYLKTGASGVRDRQRLWRNSPHGHERRPTRRQNVLSIDRRVGRKRSSERPLKRDAHVALLHHTSYIGRKDRHLPLIGRNRRVDVRNDACHLTRIQHRVVSNGERRIGRSRKRKGRPE